MSIDATNLPSEIIHKFTHPLSRYLKVQAAAGPILLFATFIAITLTNSSLSESFHEFWEIEAGFRIGSFSMMRTLRHWVNDGLMTLFFFVVALELKRELVLGELRNPRMAMLPLAGALGGMFLPALFYLFMMQDRAGQQGWGIVMATDTAFVIGCLALLGSRIPASLRLFLLSLAIFDDVGAIMVVAFGYGAAIDWYSLSFGFAGLLVIFVTARMGVRSLFVYSFWGFLVWTCFDFSGLHPTIAGVILGLMTPARGWISDERLRFILGRMLAYPEGDHWSGDTTDRHDLRQAGVAMREVLSPIERLEIRLHPWVGFVVMPIFALANAGVEISIQALKQPISMAIIIGLVFGKSIGVFIASWLAVRFGIASLFSNLNWPLIAAGGMLTGIGFTMSLFIAGLAFDSSQLATAKIGILSASILAATLGTFTLWRLTRSSDFR